MKFHDTTHLYKPVDGRYQQSISGEAHEVAGSLEQTSGMTRGGHHDALVGDARAYLDGDNAWLASIGYQVEGYFLVATVFGQTINYRIISVAIGRRIVTDGSVSHIEVELEKVDLELEGS